MTTGMKALRGRAGGVFVMLLSLGPALIATAPSAAASTPSAASVAAYEARVIQQINVQRASYHRGKVVASSCPDRYAEAWAAYLARTGAFYHYSMSNILRAVSYTHLRAHE